MYGSLSQLGNNSVAAAYCCSQLANILGSKVSFPGSASYLATEASYWSLQEANLSPSCIVVPETAQDVSRAVTIIVGIANCELAIKGQSHAPAAGFANINDGVTIDMTNLSSVAVNADRSIASVGAGASWLDVYSYLDKLGLSVAGGRNGAVGVGGLTLGGGISYFSPRVGFTCDTVINFEIVLPNGILANVNSTSHPSLFRALKGGGNNFGIVTRIDFTPLTQGLIVGGSIVNSISEVEAVFEAFSGIAGADEYDPYASLVTGLLFNSTSKAWSLSSAAIYTKPVLNPPVYEALSAVPKLEDTRKVINLSTLATEAATPQLNWLFYTGTFGVSATLMNKIFSQLNTTLYDFDIPDGIVWSIAFEPLPTVMTQYGSRNGRNSLGTSPADGNAFIMLLAALWDSTPSNSLVSSTAQKLGRAIAEIAQDMGLLHRFEYANYADPSQRPIESYGEENVVFLREVEARYDPRGVWRDRVRGGWKI